MDKSSAVPEFDPETFCVTAAASAALDKRGISPTEFFDAHKDKNQLTGATAIKDLKNIFGLCGKTQTTSNFYVSASIADRYPAVELYVETSPDGKTTVLMLKSETI